MAEHTELPAGPPLNHGNALEEAQRYFEFSNLSRCYLALLAERDALQRDVEIARAMADENYRRWDALRLRIETDTGAYDALANHFEEQAAQLTTAEARADRFAQAAADMQARALAAEAALSACHISQKGAGNGT